MPELRIEAKIAAKSVSSLLWDGDSLIDWVSGGQRFELDGRTIPRKVYYAFRFDAAVTSPSGQYVVIYERLGTKGLLLCNGSIVREINRSYYHANAYEYPICFAKLDISRSKCPRRLLWIPINFCLAPAMKHSRMATIKTTSSSLKHWAFGTLQLERFVRCLRSLSRLEH